MRAWIANDDQALGVGLSVVSFVILAYEVTQLRVFAYVMTPLLSYGAIAVTMLGFGIASTVVALSPRIRRAAVRPLAAACCLGLALTGVLANVVLATLAPRAAATLASTTAPLGAMAGLVVACTLPYLCGGLMVTLVLSRRLERAGRSYFLNLLGSGLGCLGVTVLLRPLGAERLLLALLSLAAIAGALLARKEAPRLRTASLAVAAALVACLPWAPRVLAFSPDPADHLAIVAAAYRQRKAVAPVLELGVWDPVARIEIHSWPGEVVATPSPVRFKLLTQDGGASSLLLAMGEAPPGGARLFDKTAYGVAYALRPEAKVLVIGMGGGPDVQAALAHGARRITAVEINASTIDLVRGRYADFLGRPLADPRVETVLSDGRAFVRRTRERYDVIQMSGTDTLTLQSAGSFVLAEEYLYTEEAFGDYLRVLADDGILSILRFGQEPVRLSSIAVRALRRLGVAHPEQHIVLLSQSAVKDTLVKRSPWTADELARLDEIVAQSAASNRGIEVPAMGALGLRLAAPLRYLYSPERRDAHPTYAALFRQVSTGAEPEVVVPTDDRPYYFGAELLGYFKGGLPPGPAKTMMDVYAGFVLVVLVLAVGAILLPSLVLRWRGQRPARAAVTVIYFFLLGFSFMLLEIGLIQKAAIVVEHPAYSVAVVLATLLGASSLGSLASQRLRWSLRAIVLSGGATIVLLGIGYAFGLDLVFGWLMPLPLPVRMTAVAALLTPLGAAMGMLFPSGLRALAGNDRDPGALVPWAIAANGFASVMGSVLALPLAVMVGFSGVLLRGVLGYVVACGAFLIIARAKDGPDGTGTAQPSAPAP